MSTGTAAPSDVYGQLIAGPVQFMLQNIVRVDYNDPVVTFHGGIGTFTLVSVEQPGKRFHGEPIPVYSLQNGKTSTVGGFNAYWCPYSEDEIKMTTVGEHAELMFTETMSGCSFGVGSVASDGTQLVGHANSSGVGEKQGFDQQATHQRGLLDTGLGKGGIMLEPASYRLKPGEEEPLLATTFGVRNQTTNRWSYYTQLRQLDPMGNLILRAVKEVA